MAYTKLQIYQMAADRIDDEVIVTVNDDTKVVRWLNRNYALTKETLLSSHRWKFAKTRANLAQIVGDTGSEWLYKYQTPADALLIYRPTDKAEIGGVPIPYEYESYTIFTDQSPPFPIRYIKNVNEDKFTPLFVNSLVAALAHGMSHWAPRKMGMVDLTEKALTKSLRTAMMMDAIENFTEPQTVHDIELVRYREG